MPRGDAVRCDASGPRDHLTVAALFPLIFTPSASLFGPLNAAPASSFALMLAIGCVGSALLTGAVRAVAISRRIYDWPNARSSHSEPTPRGGGVGVLAALLLGLAIGVVSEAISGRIALTFAIGVVALGTVGWMDDTRGMAARWRFGTHAVVAVWTLTMLDGMPSIRMGTASLHVGAGGWLLGMLGIIWSINLFNFMDGIDGLAGSQAVLIFGGASMLLASRGDSSLAAVCVLAAGSSLGFLLWNWPPAKIFLGDVGSGALGYLIAAIAIASENRGSVSLLAFAILGGVFVFDATVTLIRRVARGHSPAAAHREHAYQRLARTWGSHRHVTVWAAVATLGLAVIGTVATIRPRLALPLALTALAALTLLYIVIERRVPMRSTDAVPRPAPGPAT